MRDTGGDMNDFESGAGDLNTPKIKTEKIRTIVDDGGTTLCIQ